MKHAFNIYPALFILTPVIQGKRTQAIDEVSGIDSLHNEHYYHSMLRVNVDMVNCLLLELIDEKIAGLKPAKFKGKRFTITYIPVLN